MKSYTKYIFLLFLLLSHISFAQTQEPKPKKKHKLTDTVGVVNGSVIRLSDYREQLATTLKEHKNEIKDSSLSPEEVTKFVNMTWDKIVEDIIIENEIEKRKLTLSTDKTIERLLKNTPKELKESFTDSTGRYNEKALKAYLKNPNPDFQRTKILDYYQLLYEQQRLASQIAPNVKSEEERMKGLGLWLKQKIAKANIDDRRTAFGYY